MLCEISLLNWENAKEAATQNAHKRRLALPLTRTHTRVETVIRRWRLLPRSALTLALSHSLGQRENKVLAPKLWQFALACDSQTSGQKAQARKLRPKTESAKKIQSTWSVHASWTRWCWQSSARWAAVRRWAATSPAAANLIALSVTSSAAPSPPRAQPTKREFAGTIPSFYPILTPNLCCRPFSAELERHQELATQKWGFDFRAGCPLAEKSSFIWERVSFQESSFAPEMYTLTRAAHVRPESSPSDMDVLMNERSERENFGTHLANSSLESNTDNDSCYDSQDESLASRFTSSSLSSPVASTSSIVLRKRQPKITGEFRPGVACINIWPDQPSLTVPRVRLDCTPPIDVTHWFPKGFGNCSDPVLFISGSQDFILAREG